MGQAAAGLSVRQGRANMPLLEDVQKPEARKAFEAESNDFDRPKRAWRNQLAEHWGADVELARAANDGSNVDTVSPTVLSVSTCRPGGYLCTTLPNYFPSTLPSFQFPSRGAGKSLRPALSFTPHSTARTTHSPSELFEFSVRVV